MHILPAIKLASAAKAFLARLSSGTNAAQGLVDGKSNAKNARDPFNIHQIPILNTT